MSIVLAHDGISRLVYENRLLLIARRQVEGKQCAPFIRRPRVHDPHYSISRCSVHLTSARLFMRFDPLIHESMLDVPGPSAAQSLTSDFA